ncbi:hypothetical protein G4G29_19080 [Microbacterium sp. Se63.02b]|nr:hypothetical protein G4G29_19080 [Microbacterium sp. Se63.02b]
MRSHDIITAVPLSFDQSGGLDLDGSRRILEYVAASGVQGALVLGTTGEFPRCRSRSATPSRACRWRSWRACA